MSRVFLAERLTSPVLETFARSIQDAAVCSAVDAPDSATARGILDDPRWKAGAIPPLDRTSAALKEWCRELVFAQPLPGSGHALLACGLEARLRLLPPALMLYETCASSLPESDQIDLHLVADDPYLRDCFSRGDWLSRRPRSVHLSGLPDRSLLRPSAARERIAGQLWLRAPPWRRRRASPLPAGNDQRTVVVMAIARRSLAQLQTVLERLAGDGWRIVIVHYGRQLSDGHVAIRPLGETTISFTEASKGWQLPRIPTPQWVLTGDLLGRSPISEPRLRLALSACWTTALVQIGRHQRVLERFHPSVIFGYGADVPSLALQVAADDVATPTIYAPHGFEVRARSFFSFFTTATALYGPACAAINATGPGGQRFRGLVPTGHPPYDAMLEEFARTQGRRQELPGLVPPSSRPYLVLALAGWGFDLLCHLHQERMLRLMVAALPDDAYLLCKLHPAFEERAFCEKILAAGLPPDAFRMVGERDFTTHQLLAGCHVAVSNERSMVLTDAIVMGRPSIGIRQPESPPGHGDRDHPGKNFDRNCLIVADAGELRSAIEMLTRDTDACARLLAQRQSYIDEFLMGDGRAAERVAALAERLASGAAPVVSARSAG